MKINDKITFTNNIYIYIYMTSSKYLSNMFLLRLKFHKIWKIRTLEFRYIIYPHCSTLCRYYSRFRAYTENPNKSSSNYTNTIIIIMIIFQFRFRENILTKYIMFADFLQCFVRNRICTFFLEPTKLYTYNYALLNIPRALSVVRFLK